MKIVQLHKAGVPLGFRPSLPGQDLADLGENEQGRSLVIERRGTPKAVLLSIRDYVKLAPPEPEVLRVIGEESERNGTSTLTSRQIDQIIKTSRSQKPKR